MAKRLPPVDVGEEVPLTFDFSNDVGDSPTGLDVDEVTCELIDGMTGVEVPSPTSILVGEPWLVGAVVWQMVRGETSGAYYRIKATVRLYSSPQEVLSLTSIVPVRKS